MPVTKMERVGYVIKYVYTKWQRLQNRSFKSLTSFMWLACA